jgi:hypothetical protein
MSDAEERMLLDDKNKDPTERNSRCTEEVTNADLFSLLKTYMNDKLKDTCITTLIIHKYISMFNVFVFNTINTIRFTV